MITPETVGKWIGVGAAGVAAVYFAVAPVVLFLDYRSDYIKAGLPEPTLLAFRLTLSSLRKMKKFKAGDIEHPHKRSEDSSTHKHVRAADLDMGTVSRSLADFGDIPKRKRRSGDDVSE